MATILNLPYKRYVKQVSGGAPKSKYSFLSEQSANLEALMSASWRLAGCPNDSVSCTINSVTATDGNYTTYINDKYDAFKQSGDGVTAEASQCAYAGMAAYRFTLPTNYTERITSISVPVNVDRYNRSGVRVVAVLSNNKYPSDDWSEIRGDDDGAVRTESTASAMDGVASFGFLGKVGVINLVSGKTGFGTASLSGDALSTTTRYQYLWIYISLEDYTDHWIKYNNDELRNYYIEGSAMIQGNGVQVYFDGDFTPEYNGAIIYLIKDSVLPKFQTDRSNVMYAQVQMNGDSIPEKEEDAIFSASAEASNIGLLSAYGKLISGSMDVASTDLASPQKTRLGAAFVVNKANIGIPTLDYAQIPMWQITTSALLLPFTIPTDPRPTALRLDWNSISGFSPTEGSRLNVWIKKNEMVVELPKEVLQNKSIYMADAANVGGFELLATFDANVSGKTREMKLPILTGNSATIMLTAYIDIAAINMLEGATYPQGVGGMTIDAASKFSQNMNNSWIPDVALVI